MNNERVVITGLGGITPIGLNIETFWESIIKKKNGTKKIKSFDTSNFNVHFACEINDFDPLNYVNPKELRRVDRSTCFALAAADEAINDAKILDKKDTGVIIGTGIGGISAVEKEYTKLFGDKNHKSIPEPFFMNKIIPNTPSSFISIKYGFHGPSFGVSSACSSSLSAIITAYNLIKAGDSNIMIAGGTEAAITPWGISNFDIMRALSRNNDNYQTASKPFDENRDGFVIGEGAGVIVLESLKSAVKRGVKIYGEIIGYGLFSEAYHITNPNATGEYIAKCMENALLKSKITPQDVDYINLHGTSTQMGDLAEANAVYQVFKNQKCKLTSTKANTGHMIGAAGAIETIACLLSMKNNVVPQMINTTKIDGNINKTLNFIIDEHVKTDINIAINNSFGFGGHNSSIILKKFK